MTYGPQPGWNPNQPPGPPPPGYPAPPPGYPAQQPMAQPGPMPPGPMPMGPPPGQYPMGPGQPGNQPPASPTAMIAGVLALLTLVLMVVNKILLNRFRFSFHWPYLLQLPGFVIAIALLGAGGVMLLIRKRPGQIIAIVGAVVALPVVLVYEGGRYLGFGVLATIIATIVLSALPSTARVLTGPAARPPFMPMGPPGQFGPPQGQPMPGQPMPGQPMPPQQFPQQQGPQGQYGPSQQPPMPPPGYPPQQFPPPPPGQ